VIMKTKKLALKILQAETDGFETQSRLRDDVLDAMVRFESENKQCNIAVVSKQRELLIAYAKIENGGDKLYQTDIDTIEELLKGNL